MNEIVQSGGECDSSGVWSSETGAVLVVEDCEPLLFYLNSALLALDYEDQHLAANIAEAEAVWALHKDEIRHIILNYELPDGIGLDFAARVRQESPDVNVVITTGYDVGMVKEACGHLKEMQFLQKPFRLGDLKNVMAAGTFA